MTADWGAFYLAVCARAGSLLVGIDEETATVIQEAATSDIFWSDSMLATFEDFSAESPREGIEAALEVWRENVLEVFGDLLDLDRRAVRVDPAARDLLADALEAGG